MSARDLLINAMVQAGWTERMATQLVASVRAEAVTDWKKEASSPKGGPALPRIELSDVELAALARVANRAVADAIHEDLCRCAGWPNSCTSGYTPTHWVTGAYHRALPPVIALWEGMRLLSPATSVPSSANHWALADAVPNDSIKPRSSTRRCVTQDGQPVGQTLDERHCEELGLVPVGPQDSGPSPQDQTAAGMARAVQVMREEGLHLSADLLVAQMQIDALNKTEPHGFVAPLNGTSNFCNHCGAHRLEAVHDA
ncbi:hypothetical protein [Streptomyces pseudovenezuelae]|uniref:hypothetical protein n=1 Tax=Streptomyces pseudovenezuelae TaxID=67350 RepID=UPI0036E6603D